MKKWRRGKGTMFTASCFRMERREGGREGRTSVIPLYSVEGGREGGREGGKDVPCASRS